MNDSIPTGNDFIGRRNDFIGRGNDFIGRGNEVLGRRNDFIPCIKIANLEGKNALKSAEHAIGKRFGLETGYFPLIWPNWLAAAGTSPTIVYAGVPQCGYEPAHGR